MSTAQEHGSIPSTAVEAAPGLWRTNLQRYDLSVPGREMIQARVDIEPDSPPIRHFHPGEEIIYVLEGPWNTRSTASRRRCTAPARPWPSRPG
jgi:quercetin dioxygenase-like cupin family protein